MKKGSDYKLSGHEKAPLYTMGQNEQNWLIYIPITIEIIILDQKFGQLKFKPTNWVFNQKDKCFLNFGYKCNL